MPKLTLSNMCKPEETVFADNADKYIRALITCNGIRVKLTALGVRRDVEANWEHEAFIVSIEDQDFEYKRGMGHHGKKFNWADFFHCLVMDWASVRRESNYFEDWADCLGYDKDSRKAEATYNACREEARKLENVFGTDTLIWMNEELFQDY